MRLSEIKKPTVSSTWNHRGIDPSYVYENRHDSQAVCDHAKPHLVINLNQYRDLHEANYRELSQLVDGDFLGQQVRADQLSGIFYRGFTNNTMTFEVNSSNFSNNRTRYRNLIEFEDWDKLGQDPELNAVEKARLLLWVGNIKFHCTCPSFLYWGYQYLLTQLDSAIYPEQRPPNERNPNDRGIICKHGNRILRVLPFFSGSIAKEFNQQFGS